MNPTPEGDAPVPEAHPVAPAASPDEVAFARNEDGRRPWLRAGVLFGGALAWSTAVFGGMAEHDLWTGGSAGFGLTLVLVILWVLSVRSVYRSPARSVGRLIRRAMATLALGIILWMIFVFITLVVCERSASGAMLVLGFFGMLTIFIVVGLLSRGRTPRHEPAIRAVRALAWLTVLLVSVTALVPPLAEAMARRGRRALPTADVTDMGDE